MNDADHDAPYLATEPSSDSSRRLFSMVIAGIVLVLLAGGIGLVVFSNVTRRGTRLIYSVGHGDAGADPMIADAVAGALYRRLRGYIGGGLSVTAIDAQHVQVIVPTIDSQELGFIKKLIGSTGTLRFLIIANPHDHPHLLDLVTKSSTEGVPPDSDASVLPPRDVLDENGEIVGRWVTNPRERKQVDGVRPLRVAVDQSIVRNTRTGQLLHLPEPILGVDDQVPVARWMDGQQIETIDLLAVVDPELQVGGEDLSFAASALDQSGKPAIDMTFGEAGGARLYALTLANQPRQNQMSRLGTVLDDQLLAAPNIRGTLRSEARLTGEFTSQEVDLIVRILTSGQLPADVSDQPTEETTVSVPVPFLDMFGI